MFFWMMKKSEKNDVIVFHYKKISQNQLSMLKEVLR